MKSLPSIKKLSYQQRINILKSIYYGGGGHVGGAYSIIDFLTYIYSSELKFDLNNLNDPDRDRLILSKGHACLALYWTLVEFGFFPKKILLDYGKDGSLLAGHPEADKVPGVEISSGSLGHGPAFGLGMAYAAKLKKQKFQTYVIVGDGETNEGAVWETVLSASQLKLDNFVMVIDNNKLESLDSTDNILKVEPLTDKFEAFGFDVKSIDGHNFEEISDLFNSFLKNENGRPKCIVLNTIKGSGISYMENDTKWHSRAPSEKEFHDGLIELKGKIDAICV